MTTNVQLLSSKERKELYNDKELKLKTDPTSTKIKYPNQFDFNGKVIFISNLHASKIDDAIKSRSMIIDITLKQQDIIKRIQTILPNIEKDQSMEDKMEVLKYLEEKTKIESNKVISMRSFILALKMQFRQHVFSPMHLHTPRRKKQGCRQMQVLVRKKTNVGRWHQRIASVRRHNRTVHQKTAPYLQSPSRPQTPPARKEPKWA